MASEHSTMSWEMSSEVSNLLLVDHQMLHRGMWRNIAEVDAFLDVFRYPVASLGFVLISTFPPLPQIHPHIT